MKDLSRKTLVVVGVEGTVMATAMAMAVAVVTGEGG